MKKRWIVTAVLVGILAIGLTGGTILANAEDEDGETQHGKILSRFAEIMGLDGVEVEDAFNQAQQEIRDEAMQDRLAQMVEDGILTQEQADEYKAWHDARPDMPGIGQGGPGFGNGFHKRGRGFGRGHGGHMRGGIGNGWSLPQAPEIPADTSLQSF